MAKVKRDKRSRLRGRKTGGHGSRKKRRGSGSRGGKGMAGTGKKAGQKRTLVLKLYGQYLGKKGFIRHGSASAKFKEINLEIINSKLPYFEKEGLAKKTPEGIEIRLENYKVLGEGDVEQKLVVIASGFSASAKKKIEAKGGKAQILE